MIWDWFIHIHPVAQALIRVLLIVLPILILVPGMIWWERRLLSWMQDRIGPNRVATLTLKNGKKISFWGLLQPIADGVKLFLKEDITPAAADKAIYFIAPALALFPAFALSGTLPWGPIKELTPIADVNIGVLYVMAISSLGVYGVVLAGYSGNNKYSLMGGLRASAQLISYELAMGMSLACMVLATGSLRMTDMVKDQEGPLLGLANVPVVNAIQNWHAFTPFGFISMVIFMVCMVAETNRAPFDLPEAENELIAGYHTEYSSMKFAVFFMGEYAAMFTFAGVLSVVFFGGYHMLPIRWEFLSGTNPQFASLIGFFRGMDYWLAPIWFLTKCVVFLSAFIWLRATLPRLRYDQLMSLGWKSLLPAALANFLVVTTWIFCNQMYGPVAGLGSVLVGALVILGIYRGVKKVYPSPVYEDRTITLVDPAKAAG